MQTVKIFHLKKLSKAKRDLIFAGQREAARVWNLCCVTHKESREKKEAWPRKAELQQLTKGQFAIHSQSVQMVCHTFLANVDTAMQIKKINRKIRLPYKEKYFYPLIWPKQAISMKEGLLILPMGRGRASLTLSVDLQKEQIGSCKIIWNDGYELHVAVEQKIEPLKEDEPECLATVDLGQIHLAAVSTETEKAQIVTGRGIRALKQIRSKQIGKITKKQSKCKKRSRRWRKLQKSKRRIKARSRRRIRDQRHKATTAVIDFCKKAKVTKLYVGDPGGVEKKKCGRHHNQRMSQWEFGKDIHYLKYKAKKAGILSFSGTERGTSSSCPKCGHKKKAKGRNWECPSCKFHCHRDIVGSMNMFPLAFGKTIETPKEITYLRPGRLRQPRSSNSLDTGQSCFAELGSRSQQKSFCVMQVTDPTKEKDLQEAHSL